MAKVYSAELFFAHELLSEDVVIPEDQRWIVRTVTLFSAGLGGGGWFQIQRLADSLTLYDLETSLGLFDSFKEDPDIRLVLMEGATYTMKAGNKPDVTLFGYVLSLP